MVVHGAVIVGVGGVESVAQAHLLPALGSSRGAAHGDGLCALWQGERHVIVGVVYGQAHVHGHFVAPERVGVHLGLAAEFLDGEYQVLGLFAYVHYGERVAVMLESQAIGLLGVYCSRGEGHRQAGEQIRYSLHFVSV